MRTVVFSQDGEIASLRRNDKHSTFHDGEIASLRRNDKHSTFHDGQGLSDEFTDSKKFSNADNFG